MWIIFVNSYKNCKLRKKLKIVGFLVEFFLSTAPGAPTRLFCVDPKSLARLFIHQPPWSYSSAQLCALCVPKILNGEFFPQGWINAPAVPEKGKNLQSQICRKMRQKFRCISAEFYRARGERCIYWERKNSPLAATFFKPWILRIWSMWERERGAGLAGGAGRVARSNIWVFWEGTPCDLRGFYPLWYNLPMKSCHLPFRNIQVN